MKFFAMIMAAAAGMLLVTGCSSIKDLNVALNQNSVITENYSSAGLNILRNKTTKNEISEAIGAPGLVFKNEIQGESWVYPRVAVRQDSAGYNASANLALVFPFKSHTLSHGGGLAGVGGNAAGQYDKTSYKTAGLLIKFDKKGVVHSYEFRATSF